MGGRGSTGNSRTLRGQAAVSAVSKLNVGSKIAITYSTGRGSVTDTLELKQSHDMMGRAAKMWINQTNNGGFANIGERFDASQITSLLSSPIRAPKLKIIKKK